MDKMEKFIYDVSKQIDNSIERKKSRDKEIVDAVKFLIKCLLLPYKNLKEYLDERKRL